MENSNYQHHMSAVADILERRREQVVATYEERLHAIQSSLVGGAAARAQTEAQARSVLEDVVRDLRGQRDLRQTRRAEDRLSATIGASRAREGVHPSESLRAVMALSDATLSIASEELPNSPTSRSEVAAVALAIQRSIMERVANASVSYVNYLIGELHNSHANERRKVGRELHDEVAHTIMVTFRSLELCEFYLTQDPDKAREHLGASKEATQQALELTRSLSKELRASSAEEGLEMALSNYLRLIVSRPDFEARVSVDGDERLIPPEVRDELFLILREAIRNAVVHSGARQLMIMVLTARDQVRATVEDDGRGLEAEGAAASPGGIGLASMKERAALLGGTLTVASDEGAGTRVEVAAPLPKSPP